MSLRGSGPGPGYEVQRAEAPHGSAEPPGSKLKGATPLYQWVGSAVRHGGGLIVAIVVLAVFFGVYRPVFLGVGNLFDILQESSSLGIIVLGELLVLLSGEIDLSVGSVYGLCAMVTGLLWINGAPFLLCFLAGLGVGAIAGFVNGLVTTRLGVNSFVATLGMLNLAEGIDYLISNSASINPSTSLRGYPLFAALGQDTVGQIPVQVLWFIGVIVLLGLVIHRSMFGFRTAAIGGNRTAAALLGLPVRTYKVAAFVVSGMLAGLAGMMAFSFAGATDPTSGGSLPFTVFAGVIIGGASLSGGRGTVLGAVLGALFLGEITDGLSIVGAGPFVELVFVGVIMIVAVAIDRWSTVRAERSGTGSQW